MTILCCGDRHWKDKRKIKKTLELFLWASLEKIVVHGGAPGADTLSGEAAEELGFAVREYKAKWKKYKKAAGPIRNQLMLTAEEPDVVIAFHGNLKKSKGTRDLIQRAIKKGILVIRIE